jgi:hypothetical protein
MYGVAPLGVLQSELQEDIATNNTKHITLKYGVIGSSIGWFGALDLTGNSGAANYRKWIASGYPGQTSINDVLMWESGNMVGATYEGFTARYDACTHFDAQTGGPGCTVDNYDPTCPRIITVVVYKEFTGRDVQVVGFAAFILEKQDSRGNITGSFLNLLTPGEAASGSAAGSDLDFGVYSLKLVE